MFCEKTFLGGKANVKKVNVHLLRNNYFVNVMFCEKMLSFVGEQMICEKTQSFLDE